jgi:hypothetical protein
MGRREDGCKAQEKSAQGYVVNGKRQVGRGTWGRERLRVVRGRKDRLAWDFKQTGLWQMRNSRKRFKQAGVGLGAVRLAGRRATYVVRLPDRR